MDVEALRLLHTQRDALKRLPDPDDADMKVDKYEATVTKTMANTFYSYETEYTFQEIVFHQFLNLFSNLDATLLY
jgi:hypothetical protein